MTDIETLQKRLVSIACPICRKNEFQIALKSENTDGERSYTAHCKGCRYLFPVSAEITLFRRSNPDVDIWHKAMQCPKCEETGAELDFRCTVSVRESRHFVRCRHCGHEYNEIAPSEAFE